MPAGFGLKRQYSKYCGLVMVPLHSVYHTLNPRHATIGGERGRPPLPYFENRKKVPRFCKKCPDRDHLWVKFSIQNVILRISRIKKLKFFPAFFFCFWQNVYKSASIPRDLPCPKKFLVAGLNPLPPSPLKDHAIVQWSYEQPRKSRNFCKTPQEITLVIMVESLLNANV